MPQIRNYEMTVTLRFEISGPLAYHEAMQVAEDRVAKALESEVPAHSDPVKSARLVRIEGAER